MTPFPTSSAAQHARLMEAFCADLATEFRTGKTPRADRVAEIAKQIRRK